MDFERRGQRWPAAVVLLAGASSICVGLIALRIALSRQGDYSFLVWNLALAWVPLGLALAVWGGARRGAPRAALVALGGLWLLFLPNAPYIATDYVHLFRGTGGAHWYDALAISAYALTGLLLGFASLYLMQAVARRALGERLTWLLVFATLAASSVGIYLGRYQRLNSWDALRDPTLVPAMARARLGDPFGNPALIVITLSFTGLLAVGYVAVYAYLLPRFESRWGREPSP